MGLALLDIGGVVMQAHLLTKMAIVDLLLETPMVDLLRNVAHPHEHDSESPFGIVMGLVAKENHLLYPHMMIYPMKDKAVKASLLRPQ